MFNMTEIRKIVIDSYPVANLPPELRNRLESQFPVRLTIEQDIDIAQTTVREPQSIHEAFGIAKGLHASQGLDPTQSIRELRDEWD
jgi:hypothetical protein